MSAPAAPAAPAASSAPGLLRFITCGSVDDGKSTLIGRLLFDAQALPDDQLAALTADSRRWGTQGGELDFALLLDGLSAEREQGITIDVAYRYFGTPRRSFIVADTPGHEQYTRNMVTGASTADVAVILVDATQGLLTQTRRHSCLVSLLGVRQLVLAVNKVDMVAFDEATVARIDAEFRSFAQQLGVHEVTTIPVSGLRGDNVVRRSALMPWYAGPTLLEYLETCETNDAGRLQQPLRLPVQWVNRPDADFRGLCGLIAGGQVRPGDRVRVLPSGRESVVARIVAFEGYRSLAVAGESVTLTLQDEIDVARGDVICSAAAPAQVADQFECTLVWMDDEPLLPGRRYWLMLGTRTVNASVTEIKHRLNVHTLEHMAARTLALNEIGVCKLALDAPVPFEPYAAPDAVNREMGGFILVDRLSNHTAAAGMLHFALRRAQNIHLQPTHLDKAARAALLGQTPRVLWFTGLSGAGKSSIANEVASQLHAMGRHVYQLDGDNLRHGLNRDLGFTDADRVENIRRVAEVARLMVDAGLIVLASFISPFRSERELARSRLAPGEFIEVHVDVPLAVAEARDPKGLYARARRGELPNFTGIDSPYEPPEAPEVHLRADQMSVAQAAAWVMDWLSAQVQLTG